MRNHTSMTPARYSAGRNFEFLGKFCVWDMKILLCSIEQKTPKNLAQLRKILSKKAKLSKKTVVATGLAPKIASKISTVNLLKLILQDNDFGFQTFLDQSEHLKFNQTYIVSSGFSIDSRFNGSIYFSVFALNQNAKAKNARIGII